MDPRFEPTLDGHMWSGILQAANTQWFGASHGQQVMVPALSSTPDQKVMLYNWRVSCTSGLVHLLPVDSSQLVTISPDSYVDIYKTKEVCAGIGGISSGLSIHEISSPPPLSHPPLPELLIPGLFLFFKNRPKIDPK